MYLKKIMTTVAFAGVALTAACASESQNTCVNTGTEIQIKSTNGKIIMRGDIINEQMNSRGTIIKLEAIDLTNEARSFSFTSNSTNGQSSCSVTVGLDTVSLKAKDKSGFTNPIPN